MKSTIYNLLLLLIIALPLSCNTANKYPYERQYKPSKTTTNKEVEKAYNIERYTVLAKKYYDIDIKKIFLGHNKTGLPAVIVNTPKKWKEDKLREMQDNLNTVFAEYSHSKTYTIVTHKNRPYAMMMANRDRYYQEKRWVSVYKYNDAMNTLKQQAKAFKSKFSTYPSLTNHQIVGIYYGLEWVGLPQEKAAFPRSLICFTKDKEGNYFRFNVYEEKIGDLWAYRYDEEKHGYFSTGARQDPQIHFMLNNGDLISLSLYYFNESDERYGGLFLKIE